MDMPSKETMLAELMALADYEPMRPGDITRTDYAEAAGVGYQAATHYLDKLVAQGVLTVHSVRREDDGRIVIAYRKKEINSVQ